MNDTPTLQGFGVCLVPLSLEHLLALERTHDADTWRFMSETGETAPLLRAFAERALVLANAGACQVWVTTLQRPEGGVDVAGCTRLADLNRTHRTGEIGWTWVSPAYRGAGLNIRVKLLQLQHAFETLGLRRVALKTHHANLRSQKAMLKLGAQYEGTFRNHLIMPDGSSRDTKWYSIIDTDWPQVKALLLDRIAHEEPTLRPNKHHERPAT